MHIIQNQFFIQILIIFVFNKKFDLFVKNWSFLVT